MDDPNYVVEIDGRKWTPTEISALILAKLKRDCRAAIGPISEDVSSRCLRTSTNWPGGRPSRPGSIAGLEVKRIVNEPTAAALYYAHVHEVAGTG